MSEINMTEKNSKKEFEEITKGLFIAGLFVFFFYSDTGRTIIHNVPPL